MAVSAPTLQGWPLGRPYAMEHFPGRLRLPFPGLCCRGGHAVPSPHPFSGGERGQLEHTDVHGGWI